MENMDVTNELESSTEKKFYTLGEFLRHHRKLRKITLEEMSFKTKIRFQQLVYLEENQFDKLPTPIYLQGFIKSICHLLEADVNVALKFMQKEEIKGPVIEIRQPGKVIKPLHFNFKFFDKSKLKVNHKLLLASFVAVAIGGSFLVNMRFSSKSVESSIVHRQPSFFEKANIFPKEPALTNEDPPERFKVDPSLASPVNEIPGGNFAEERTFIPPPLIAQPVIFPEQFQPIKPAQPAVQQPQAPQTQAIEIQTLKPHLNKVSVTGATPVANPVATTAALVPSSPVEQVKKKLSIKAKKGVAFLVYRVNGEKKNKIYLKSGRTLDLEGNEIRLEVGNPDAVEFTKNGEPLDVKPEPGESTLKISL